MEIIGTMSGCPGVLMPNPPSWAAQTQKLDRAARRKAKGPGPEKVVQKAIVEAFRAKYRIGLIHIDAGGAGYRAEGGGGYSTIPAGFPDLLGVIPPTGRALFIEVKAPGKKPTQAQLDYMALLRAKGAMVFWADSVQSALFQFESEVAA